MAKKTLLSLIPIILFSKMLLYLACNDDTTSSNGGDYVIDAEPCWSPDGTKILYVSNNQTSNFGIYSIDIVTKVKRLIVEGNASNPDLSPNGKVVAYELGGNIFTKNIELNSEPVQLTFRGSNFYPSWSNDGNWIAFDSNDENPNGMHFIWKMFADGTKKKRIIYTPQLGEVRQPDWFSDGIRLVVSRYVGHGGAEIAIIDTLGNSLSLLTNDAFNDYSPKVSYDGNYIVYGRKENHGQICIIKSDGTEFFQLLDKNSLFPNWSPDGAMIAYTNNRFNDGRIWIINRYSSIPIKVTN